MSSMMRIGDELPLIKNQLGDRGLARHGLRRRTMRRRLLEDSDALHRKNKFFDDAGANSQYHLMLYLLNLKNVHYILNKFNILLNLNATFDLFLYQLMIKVYLMMKYILMTRVELMVEEFNQKLRQERFRKNLQESNDLTK